jgi:glycosyltransferase involved in cell wall biosynthesis
MKILIGPGMVPEKYGGKFSGGASFAVWNLAKKLAMNNEVYMYPLHEFKKREKIERVIVLEKNKPHLSDVRWNSITAFSKELNRYSGFLEGIKLSIIDKHFLNELNKINTNIDIVSIHGTDLLQRYSMLKYGLLNKRIITLTSHGLYGFNETINVPYLLEKRKKEFERKFYGLVDSYKSGMIFSVSSKVTNILKKEYKIKKVKTITNGVDKSFFHFFKSIKDVKKKWGVPNDKKIMLTVGTLSKRKNHILVLQSLLKIKKQIKDKIIYLIVGNGPLETDLKEFVKRNRLCSNVIFTGKLGGARPYRYLPYGRFFYSYFIIGGITIGFLRSNGRGAANNNHEKHRRSK